MFGGSGKLGRGGGGGKRNIHALPISRLSLGGAPRGSSGAPSSSGVPSMESFSLMRRSPLNYAMAIKLAPDLVDEIKRVEEQGGTARMKFDANPNNPTGNVINVGDKNFKFMWSREIPDLCDVYEEHQSGENGNGLLIESGASCRKLNVQRVLDESTKNHVKMRSEEAERKNKSRKAIVLDPKNPSMKNQMKALAAAESNPGRNFKHKKEPPSKKMKTEPTSVGPPKTFSKSGLSTTTLPKSKHSSSSPSSQAGQHGTSPSSLGSGKPLKKHPSVPDILPAQNINKTCISEKEMRRKLPSTTSDGKSRQTRNTDVKASDLRSLMISLLLDHHSTGMSLKALEKAVGDAMPNSHRQFETIMKQIANFQAPGRYFLKPGVDMESFKKAPCEIGSSPKIIHQESPALQRFDQLSTPDPSISVITVPNNEEQTQLIPTPQNAPDTIEKVDILHNSPDHSGKKKASDISDSDSDSESSDSGSPGGTQSSSDTESDSSSSSKQASDEDVDIMTSDDDIGSKHKLQNSSKSRSPDSEPFTIGKYENQNDHVSDMGNIENQGDHVSDIRNNENQDDHVTDIGETEKDFPEDNHEIKRAANYSLSNKGGEEPNEYSLENHEQEKKDVYDRKLNGGPHSGVNYSFKPGQSGSNEKLSKRKSKRHSDGKHSEENPHSSKRLKNKNLSLSYPDTDRHLPHKGAIDQMVRTFRDGPNDRSLQACDNQGIPTSRSSDPQQESKRSFEANGRAEASSEEKRPCEHDILGGAVNKYSERSPERIVKRFDKAVDNADCLASERRPTKFTAEVSGEATQTDSHYRKPELLGEVPEAGPHSISNTGHSHKNKNISNVVRTPVMNAPGYELQREISQLELGECQELSSYNNNAGPKSKSSFKQLMNSPMDAEHRNSDSSIKKQSDKIIADSRKFPPPNTEAVSGISDQPSMRKVLVHHGDHLTHRDVSQPPQQYTEVASQQNNVPQMNSKNRFAEAGTGQGPSLEVCVDTSRKVLVNAIDQQHLVPIQGVDLHSTKESKTQMPSKVGDSYKQNDATLTGSNDGGLRMRESSLGENSCSYTKYEKVEPELRGPIKNTSQYEEYVKEYQEKYESYCSLKKVLDSYSDEFSNLGKDLEAYSGRDVKKYHDVLGKIRSSFFQYGERHKRLKKIFLVLSEELKHLKQMLKDYAATDTTN